MTITAVAAPVVLTTGDGLEAREARVYPLGDYSCPFCSAAVVSPASWTDNEADQARRAAARGESYQARDYPAHMRQVWEARSCGNPACLVSLSPETCARVRADRAARESEAAARKRSHELAMQRIEETKSMQREACDRARAKCEADGYCYRCWSHSTSGGLSDSRERFTRHRNPDSCPRLRTRYGI